MRPGWSRAREAAVLLAIAAVYYAAGRLGLLFTFVHASASAVWPPTGIALAALLLYGRRAWPAVAVGAFLVNQTNASSALMAAGIALGNTLEAVLGSRLVERFAGGRRAFERPQDVLGFALLAGVAATSVSASTGVLSLWAAGQAEWSAIGDIWLTWWLGDLGGAWLVTPVILLWATRPLSRAQPARLLEGGLMAVAVAASAAFVFGRLLPVGQPVAFLCVPPLAWAAFRFGARATATATLAVSAVAVAATLQGLGPFAGSGPHVALLLLQAFMSVIGLTLLLLAVAVEGQRRAHRAIRERDEQLRQLALERSEAAVRARDLALAEAQALAHIGSWSWDAASNSVTWSDEMHRIFGREPGAAPVTYETFLAAVHPDDRGRVDHTVRRALVTREPFSFDHRIVRPDGRERWIHGRGQVVAAEDGAPRMVGTGQDITERRRAEDAGRAFLANAAHELRTPLTTMIGLADLIAGLARRAGDPQLDEYCDMIRLQGARARRLISGLLEVSRMEQGLMEVRLQPVPLDDAVRRAADAVPRPDDHALDMDVHEGLAALADPLRLEEVLVNLLQNAYAYGGSRVGVTAAECGEEVRLSVWDDGHGVPPDLVPQLFAPFARGPSARAVEGSGLGLTIVRGLVQAQGGRIWYEPREPTGAQFVVSLRRAEPAAPSAG